MTSETEHGYLVLADISGYTSYLAKVELEHAHEILTDLLAVIVEQFKQALTISKLEGDAVFANINEFNMPNGERLLELIESTYFAFRRRRDMCERQTTCTCRACASIPSLDLKFFVHHGDYIVQNISGIRELVGSDVNLIHRLTKNHITERTSWRAYTLFTEKALEHINIHPKGLHAQTETYEHLGDVPTLSLNIHPRYEEMVATNRVVIPPEEADYKLEFDFDAPPHIVWDWVMDVNRRTQAMGKSGHWSVVARPNGRSGVGAKNHCAHGKGISEETVQDWRPFEYQTSMNIDGKAQYQNMYILTPLENGQRTRIEIRMKLFNPAPLWLSRLMVKAQFAMEKPYLHWFESIKQLMEKNS
jgi:class 3 adenylate cyclase